MTPAIPCKERFCFLCAHQHNRKGVPVTRPSVLAKVKLVWGEEALGMLALENSPSQICSACDIGLGTDPNKYIKEWVREGVRTRQSQTRGPKNGTKGEVPMDWRFLAFCGGEKGKDCFFCSNMGAKNTNANRRRGKSGRPAKVASSESKGKAEGSRLGQELGSSSSSSSTCTQPVLLLVNKDVLGATSAAGSDEVIEFSQLSASVKHALLVETSQKENLAGQVSTGCASAYRKQLGQPKGKELTMPKLHGKPVTYQQVFSKQSKPRLTIGLDFLNRIQTTATISNRALERIRQLLHSELTSVATVPSKNDLQEDRATMKADWRTMEIEGGIVAMSKSPVDALKDKYGSGCIIRLSGDSGGGFFKLLAAPVNAHISHHGKSDTHAPYLLCIGDVPEKREPMAKICSELRAVFEHYRIILSGDIKWLQVMLGLTTTGCPYCVSSGRSESHRMVYEEAGPLRTTAKSKELAVANKGRVKAHIQGQRFEPLYQFEGSPYLAVACPVLHLGMNLVKALLGRYAKTHEARQKIQKFLRDNYGVAPSLPTSSSTLDRKFIQSLSLTGKDCATLATRIAGQSGAEALWESAGYDAEAATIIRLWGEVRHLVYSEHSTDGEEDGGNWIDQVEGYLRDMSRAVAELGLPVTLSLHVTLHHLLDSLEALDQAGVAAWSVTEESVESLHGVINRESSVSMVKCMTTSDAIKHLGVTYNSKRQLGKPTKGSQVSPRPRRSCAKYRDALSSSSSSSS